MTDPSAPVAGPRKRITTERRQTPFRAGIGMCIAGLVVLLAGGALAYGAQATQILAATERAELPADMSFDADARRYAIVLLRELPGSESIDRLVARTACDVTLADGSRVEVSGARPNGSIETDLGTSIGRFDAEAGPTRVVCSFDDTVVRTGYFVAVAPERNSIRIVSYILTGIGLAVIAAGVILVIIGVRGRTVITDASSSPIEPGT
jgi:hypothetical protein